MTSWTPNRSPVAAPHVHGRSNIPQVMRTVLLALLPATATGVFLFGWPALATVLLAIAGCVAANETGPDGKPVHSLEVVKYNKSAARCTPRARTRSQLR